MLLGKDSISHYTSCIADLMNMVADPRILRDRSGSRKPFYAEEHYDVDLKMKEDSLDSYHCNQDGTRLLVLVLSIGWLTTYRSFGVYRGKKDS